MFRCRLGRFAVIPVATLIGACACAMAAGCGGDPQPLAVMTRNLYLGADLFPLTGALTPADLATVSNDIWRTVQASRFTDRAVVLADEIVRTDPDVVALQEVSLFRTQTPGDWQSDAPPNATFVELDFLQLLLDQLEARGTSYRAVAIGLNVDAELPAVDGDAKSFDVRLTDRDVILVRSSLPSSAGPSGTFTAAAFLPVGGAGGTTINLNRGWVSADVTVKGKSVRVVDSHLEIGGVLVHFQESQARELASALASQGGPMILTGDFNSRADGTGSASYALLTTNSGSPRPFRDAWAYRRHPAPGADDAELTCCLTIDSPNSVANERIDLILFRGTIEPVDASVIVTHPTESGLWPSDHLGVAGKFLVL